MLTASADLLKKVVVLVVAAVSLRAQARDRVIYRRDLNQVLKRRGQGELPPALVETIMRATVKIDQVTVNEKAIEKEIGSGAVVSPWGAVLTSAHGLPDATEAIPFLATDGSKELPLAGGRGYVVGQMFDVTDIAEDVVGGWVIGKPPRQKDRHAIEQVVGQKLRPGPTQALEVLPDWLGRWTATVFDAFDVNVVYVAERLNPDLALLRLNRDGKPAHTRWFFPWKQKASALWEPVVTSGFTSHHDEYLSHPELNHLLSLKRMFSRWASRMKSYGHSGVPERVLAQYPEVWHDPRWSAAADYLSTVKAEAPANSNDFEGERIAAMVKMMLLYVPAMNPDGLNDDRVPRSATYWESPSAQEQARAVRAILEEVSTDPVASRILLGGHTPEALVQGYLADGGSVLRTSASTLSSLSPAGHTGHGSVIWRQFVARVLAVNAEANRLTLGNGRWSLSKARGLHPGEHRLHVTSGLSTTRLQINGATPHELEITAPTAPGMSGGPIVSLSQATPGVFSLQGIHRGMEWKPGTDSAGLLYLLGIANARGVDLPANPAVLGWGQGLVDEIVHQKRMH